MNCRGVEEQDVLERYLLGRLTDVEREEFEQHYFECDSCLSQLQSGLALQEELGRMPPVRTREGRASFWRLRAWTPVFAVLAVVLAAGIWWYAARRAHSVQQALSSTLATNPKAPPQALQLPTPTRSLEELTRVEPPPYSAIVLRGAEDEEHESFRRAMQLYLKNDYSGAIPGLRAAAEGSPGTASFHFYLGACYLLTGQADPAIESLSKTISLGNPAYSEPAHFYLAKAYLRKKNVSAAEEELRMTVQLGGSKAAEAQVILHQLGK